MSRFRPYGLRQQTQGSSVLVLVTRRVAMFSDQLPTVSVLFARGEEPVPLAFRRRCGQGAQDPYPRGRSLPDPVRRATCTTSKMQGHGTGI